jgi:hypothetical protein
MKAHEMLPAELIWDEDGHLGEVALTALADGEDAIVPLGAVHHATECEHCARRLGDAAVLSFDAGAAVQSIEEARSLAPSSAPRAKMPVFAVAAALLIAVVGAVPALFKDVPSVLDGLKWLFNDGLPLLADEIAHLFGGKAERTIAVVSVASTLVFLMVGVMVARSRFRGLEQAR